MNNGENIRVIVGPIVLLLVLAIIIIIILILVMYIKRTNINKRRKCRHSLQLFLKFIKIQIMTL